MDNEAKANGTAGPAVPAPTVEVMAKPMAVGPENRVVGKMTAEETLRVENISIRHENLSLLKDRLQEEANKINVEEVKLSKDVRALRAELAAKYQVDPNRMKLR